MWNHGNREKLSISYKLACAEVRIVYWLLNQLSPTQKSISQIHKLGFSPELVLACEQLAISLRVLEHECPNMWTSHFTIPAIDEHLCFVHSRYRTEWTQERVFGIRGAQRRSFSGTKGEESCIDINVHS